MILVSYDWRIALLSFVFVPVSLLTVNILGEKTRKAGGGAMEAAERVRILFTCESAELEGY
ncbi:hypothetical protein ACFTAO_02435 [Paenibacillus rhizoplanae]